MPSRLNVLHMCLSSGFGGLEMYPIRVGEVMKALGHNVYGVSQEKTRTNISMREAFDDTFTLETRGDGYRKIIRLAKWIKRYKIDYVHCHKSSDLMLAALLKKLCGFKLIYTDHMGAKRPKKDIIHRFIYRNVDLVLSISHFTRARNIKALPVPEEKVIALWLGTDVSDAKDDQVADKALLEIDLKQQFSLPSESILIGIVGRLCDGKGHLELLKAFRELESNQAHLMIVGGLTADTGGNTEYVKTLQTYISEHKLNEKVHFYGFAENPELLLKEIDIVVIPSHNEAFGLTVIEAMAAGKAIIGSSYGAIPEILENSGVLVDPFDTGAFAEAIEKLTFNSEERARLEIMSKNRAHTYFDQKQHVNTLLTLYQGL